VSRVRETNSSLRAISKLAPRLMLSFAVLAVFAPIVRCQSGASLVPSTSLSLPEYISELDRCSAALSGSPTSPAVHDLRVSLPANWTVTVGDVHYNVATDWLTGPLQVIEKNPGANPDSLAQTRRKLQTYRDAAQAMAASTASQNLSQSRTRLDAILSAREFSGLRGPSWVDVLKARVYAWIGRQLEKLFGRVGRAKSIGNLIAWSVVILAGLLLLLWTVRFLMHAGARSELDLSGATPLNRDWHRWLREARDAAARGDYRAAIHAGYWTAIVRMEETKSLPEDRSRTPRESLRLIRRESAEYAPLLQLTRRFELVWYGYRSATAADWSDAVQQLETLGCLRSSTPAISAS
jgi:hypothetical protein